MESLLRATGCFQKMSGSGWCHLVLTRYRDQLQSQIGYCVGAQSPLLLLPSSSALSSGADANERDANGDTALLYIARAG